MVQRTSDKGKPGESQRRKAMGLPPLKSDYDRQAAEDHRSLCLFGLAYKTSQAILFGWLFNLQCFVSLAQPRQEADLQNKEKAMLRNFKVLFVVIAVVAISATAYAFAAANTVPATKAGDGLGAVSGYTVTAVAYTLNGTDPSTLDSVGFDLGAAATQVEVQLVATTGTWYTCVLGTGTTWSCNTTGLTVSSIDQLRVVAASN